MPRILNKIYDAIKLQIQHAPFIKRALFNRAYNTKLKCLHNSGLAAHKLYDPLFQTIRELLGGRVDTIVTGSAPIAADVLEFFKVCFSCEVLEGYGQTESSAVSFMTHTKETVTNIVGGPTVGT